jgi:signal transduction histidine kinase
MWNLLSNAVKFTPEGGAVDITLVDTGDGVRVTVADTGHGIAPEFLPHVFDRFRQADSSSTRLHGGLGLGLAIVRHLVELHHGTVRAESDGAGSGARFIVDLPRTV